jgi:hypothetical protein
MKYVTVVAAFALSTIAFSAVAQQPSGKHSEKSSALRLADNKKCPNVTISLPKPRITRDELNKLPKNVKWDEMCVARIVGTMNQDLKDLQDRLNKPTCDPQLTQQYVESFIKNHDDSHFQTYVKLQCIAKK